MRAQLRPTLVGRAASPADRRDRPRAAAGPAPRRRRSSRRRRCRRGRDARRGSSARGRCPASRPRHASRAAGSRRSTRPRGPACAGTTHTTARRAQLAAARQEGLRYGRRKPAWSRPARCRATGGRSTPSPSRRRRCAAARAGGRAARAWSVTARSRSTERRDPAATRRAGRRPHRRRAACRSRAPAAEPAAPRGKHSRTYRSPRHRARADRCRMAHRAAGNGETDTTDSRHVDRHREPDRSAPLAGTKRPVSHQDTPPNAFACDRG